MTAQLGLHSSDSFSPNFTVMNIVATVSASRHPFYRPTNDAPPMILTTCIHKDARLSAMLTICSVRRQDTKLAELSCYTILIRRRIGSVCSMVCSVNAPRRVSVANERQRDSLKERPSVVRTTGPDMYAVNRVASYWLYSVLTLGKQHKSPRYGRALFCSHSGCGVNRRFNELGFEANGEGTQDAVNVRNVYGERACDGYLVGSHSDYQDITPDGFEETFFKVYWFRLDRGRFIALLGIA